MCYFLLNFQFVWNIREIFSSADHTSTSTKGLNYVPPTSRILYTGLVCSDHYEYNVKSPLIGLVHAQNDPLVLLCFLVVWYQSMLPTFLGAFVIPGIISVHVRLCQRRHPDEYDSPCWYNQNKIKQINHHQTIFSAPYYMIKQRGVCILWSRSEVIWINSSHIIHESFIIHESGRITFVRKQQYCFLQILIHYTMYQNLYLGSQKIIYMHSLAKYRSRELLLHQTLTCTLESYVE